MEGIWAFCFLILRCPASLCILMKVRSGASSFWISRDIVQICKVAAPMCVRPTQKNMIHKPLFTAPTQVCVLRTLNPAKSDRFDANLENGSTVTCVLKNRGLFDCIITCKARPEGFQCCKALVITSCRVITVCGC
jgi:hypothetical protein